MKKLIAALFIMAGLALPSQAQRLTSNTPVKVVVPYLTDCSSVTIGTTPVELSSNTTSTLTSYGTSAIKVTNLDAAQTVCCNQSASVSCSGNSLGDQIASSSSGPKNWLSWAINTAQTWYCVATAANVSISVCRIK